MGVSTLHLLVALAILGRMVSAAKPELTVTGCTPVTNTAHTFKCLPTDSVILTCSDVFGTAYKILKDDVDAGITLTARTVTLQYNNGMLGKGEYKCQATVSGNTETSDDAQILVNACSANSDCSTNERCNTVTKVCECKLGYLETGGNCAECTGSPDECGTSTYGECGTDSPRLCKCKTGFEFIGPGKKCGTPAKPSVSITTPSGGAGFDNTANVVLTCNPVASDTYTFAFTKNGQDVSNPAGTSSKTFSITSFSAANTGEYACKVGNTPGGESKFSDQIDVKVQDAPATPTVTPSPLKFTATTNVKLTCTTDVATTDFKWYKNGMEQGSKTDKELNLANYDVSMDGEYRCQVIEGGKGSLLSTAKEIKAVVAKPALKAIQNSGDVAEANIDCDEATGLKMKCETPHDAKPRPTYMTLKKGGAKVGAVESVTRGGGTTPDSAEFEVKASKLDATNFGAYTCTAATNADGTDQESEASNSINVGCKGCTALTQCTDVDANSQCSSTSKACECKAGFKGDFGSCKAGSANLQISYLMLGLVTLVSALWTGRV